MLVAAQSCGGRTLDADDADIAEGAAGGAGGYGGEGGAGGVGGVGGVGGGGGSGPTFNPIDCIGCVAENCPYTLQCIQEPACVEGLGCAVSQCLAGGQPDLLCVTDCFNGDTGMAYLAVQAITCVFDTCGDPCAGGAGFPF